jgi:glucokinase
VSSSKAPRPDAPVIGVDVGGTGIKALLVAGGGQVLSELRVTTPRPGPGVAGRVADAVHACVADLTRAAPRPPVAIGLAVPGIVDDEKGIAVYSENLGWHDAPLRDMLAERTALPIAFGHDVRTGGLAEARIGAGRGYASIVFLPIGTGISAALYMDGRAYTGHGYAGEIGHTDVGHGEPCVCGGTGCLEAIASAAAIARRYRARSGRDATGSLEVLRRMRDGDREAADVWHEAIDALSLALAWTCSVLAPDALILGGGLAEAGDELFAPLARRVEARLTFQCRPRHLRAALGDRAAALGSALLARGLLAAGGPA